MFPVPLFRILGSRWEYMILMDLLLSGVKLRTSSALAAEDNINISYKMAKRKKISFSYSNIQIAFLFGHKIQCKIN